jgi:5-methyltetrahydropteroyltriglutamate--homocysteine methyltransferase
MDPVEHHSLPADAAFDGGDLDCGNGLLLLIRQHIDPMERGGLLEIRSTDASVEEDLPAWCRLTGNELVSWTREGARRSYLVCKGALAERRPKTAGHRVVPVRPLERLPAPSPAPAIEPLSVMGIGSWPRPRWMLRAIHERLEGRIPEDEFQAIGDDAARLAVEAQLRAGVDVVTDGEQRRDSYASFVGGRLDNCQLIPLTDLLAMVDDPAEFEEELRALDVPAAEVRHPVAFGPLGRSRPLVAHEVRFVRTLTAKPVKVALPGPYLLTRTMWLDCLKERAYASREELAADVVRVLREELFVALAEGAALVQFDEPVLTEVVFSGAKARRSFMCGALSEKKSPAEELDLAAELLNATLRGAPRDRTAMHVCRGNWTRDEGAVLAGDYRPLLELFRSVDVGAVLLEMCTPRAGEMEVLRALPEDMRVGIGVVNPKTDAAESVEEIEARGRRAVSLFGRDRVLLVSDCGFATFADNPVASAAVAEAKLTAMSRAAARL